MVLVPPPIDTWSPDNILCSCCADARNADGSREGLPNGADPSCIETKVCPTFVHLISDDHLRRKRLTHVLLDTTMRLLVSIESLSNEVARLLPLELVALLDTLVQLKHLHHLLAMDRVIYLVVSWLGRVDKVVPVLLPLLHKISHKVLLSTRCLNPLPGFNKVHLLLKLLFSQAGIPRRPRQMDMAPRVRRQQPHQVLESLVSTREPVAQLPLNSTNRCRIPIQEVRRKLVIPLLTTVIPTLQV